MTVLTEAQQICRVCGYAVYGPVWIGELPNGACLDGMTTPCPSALRRARGEAFRRKLCPEAFDENGKILPGGILLVSAKIPDGIGYDGDPEPTFEQVLAQLQEQSDG